MVGEWVFAILERESCTTGKKEKRTIIMPLDEEVQRRCEEVLEGYLDTSVSRVLQDVRVSQEMRRITLIMPDYCKAAGWDGELGDVNLISDSSIQTSGVSGALSAWAQANPQLVLAQLVDAVEGLGLLHLNSTKVSPRPPPLVLTKATRDAMERALGVGFRGFTSQRVVAGQSITDIHLQQCGGTFTNESMVKLSAQSLGEEVAKVVRASTEWGAFRDALGPAFGRCFRTRPHADANPRPPRRLPPLLPHHPGNPQRHQHHSRRRRIGGCRRGIGWTGGCRHSLGASWSLRSSSPWCCCDDDDRGSFYRSSGLPVPMIQNTHSNGASHHRANGEERRSEDSCRRSAVSG